MIEPFVGLLAELTHRCPLACAYCSNPVDLATRDVELTAEHWARLFGEAAAAGALHVHLSGGEPAARSDLEAIVGAAQHAGLYTNLITSGLLLDEHRVAALARAGLDHLQLSVQSADAVRSDGLAGRRGAFEQKAAVAEWTVAAGIPLTVNAVLHRGNAAEVPALVGLAERWGARRLELAHAQLVGWAWHNRNALVPTEEQVALAAQAVDDAMASSDLVIDYVCPDTHGGRPKACMGGWGALFAVVAPEGSILPCHGAAALPFCFPRFPEVGLVEAWRSESFARFRSRDSLQPPCRTCPEHEDDRGGCRCQAFAATGDPSAADPACDRSPAHGQLVALRRAGSREPATPRGFTRRG